MNDWLKFAARELGPAVRRYSTIIQVVRDISQNPSRLALVLELLYAGDRITVPTNNLSSHEDLVNLGNN